MRECIWIHTHAYTHTNACSPPVSNMQTYIYLHMHIHTYIHTYVHITGHLNTNSRARIAHTHWLQVFIRVYIVVNIYASAWTKIKTACIPHSHTLTIIMHTYIRIPLPIHIVNAHTYIRSTFMHTYIGARKYPADIINTGWYIDIPIHTRIHTNIQTQSQTHMSSR